MARRSSPRSARPPPAGDGPLHRHQAVELPRHAEPGARRSSTLWPVRSCRADCRSPSSCGPCSSIRSSGRRRPAMALVKTPAEYVATVLRCRRPPGLRRQPAVVHGRHGQELFDPPNVSGWRANGDRLSTSCHPGVSGFGAGDDAAGDGHREGLELPRDTGDVRREVGPVRRAIGHVDARCLRGVRADADDVRDAGRLPPAPTAAHGSGSPHKDLFHGGGVLPGGPSGMTPDLPSSAILAQLSTPTTDGWSLSRRRFLQAAVGWARSPSCPSCSAAVAITRRRHRSDHPTRRSARFP